jgi:hypothetical protein
VRVALFQEGESRGNEDKILKALSLKADADYDYHLSRVYATL